MAARGIANGKYQGSKWISRKKRLAIYLRDGMACVYCGSAIEDGVGLTLDHLEPWIERGSNDETNLVTACQKCNSSRQDRSVREFAEAVAAYLNGGIEAGQIMTHVRECTRRALDVKAAQEIIEKRGSWQAALREAR